MATAERAVVMKEEALLLPVKSLQSPLTGQEVSGGDMCLPIEGSSMFKVLGL